MKFLLTIALCQLLLTSFSWAQPDAAPAKTKSQEPAPVPAPTPDAGGDPAGSNDKLVRMFEMPMFILYVVCGLPMMFQGYRYLKGCVCMAGLVGGQLLTYLLISTVWAAWDDGSRAVVITVMVGCLVFGLALAVLLWFTPKFGQVVKGCVTGAVLGIQVVGITTGILNSILNPFLMGGIILVFTLAGSMLGGFLKENFFIVTTSYLGSFLVFRGLGSLVGNYPNVLKQPAGSAYFMYIGLIVLHTVLGVIAQSILKKKMPAKDDSAEFTNHTELTQPIIEGGDANVNVNDANVGEGGKKEGEGDQPEGEGGKKEGEGGKPEGEGDQPEGEGDKKEGEGGKPEGEGDQPEGEGDVPAQE